MAKEQKGQMNINLIIQGKPIAKARYRFRKDGRTYDIQKNKKWDWQLKVIQQLQSQGLSFKELITEPMELIVSFYLPISKNSLKKMSTEDKECVIWHTKKPDLDNLLKWVNDCMNNFIWKDDSQVYSIQAVKYYSLNPRTEIQLNTFKATKKIWIKSVKALSGIKLACMKFMD